MTLNGRTALYCTNDASFGAHHENLKKRWTHTISSKKCSPCRDYAFRLYKVHADIRGGSEARGAQTTSVGCLKPAIVSNLDRHIFRIYQVYLPQMAQNAS